MTKVIAVKKHWGRDYIILLNELIDMISRKMGRSYRKYCFQKMLITNSFLNIHKHCSSECEIVAFPHSFSSLENITLREVIL